MQFAARPPPTLLTNDGTAACHPCLPHIFFDAPVRTKLWEYQLQYVRIYNFTFNSEISVGPHCFVPVVLKLHILDIVH